MTEARHETIQGADSPQMAVVAVEDAAMDLKPGE
jgi:hypothetical protein